MSENQLSAVGERSNLKVTSDGAISAQKDAGFNLSQAAMGLMEKGALPNKISDSNMTGLTKEKTPSHIDLTGDIYPTAKSGSDAANVAQPGGQRVAKGDSPVKPDGKDDRPNVAKTDDNSPRVLKDANLEEDGRGKASGAITDGLAVPNAAQTGDHSLRIKKTHDNHFSTLDKAPQIAQ